MKTIWIFQHFPLSKKNSFHRNYSRKYGIYLWLASVLPPWWQVLSPELLRIFLINMVMLPRTLTLYPGLLPKSGLPRATSQENCVWVSKRDKTKEKATQNAERGFRFWFWIFTFNKYCILLIFSLLFVWYGFRFFCHLVFLHGGSCRNPQYLSEMWGNFWCDLCNVGAESAPLHRGGI